MRVTSERATVGVNQLLAWSTAHDNDFEAIAELVDNARDHSLTNTNMSAGVTCNMGICDATGRTRGYARPYEQTFFWIKNNIYATVNAPYDVEYLRRIMSPGHHMSVAEEHAGIGRYGVGLKHSAFSLGDSVCVATRRGDECCAIIVSRSQQEGHIELPAIEWNRASADKPTDFSNSEVFRNQFPGEFSELEELLQGDGDVFLVIISGLKRVLDESQRTVCSLYSAEGDVLRRRPDPTLNWQVPQMLDGRSERVEDDSLRCFLRMLYLKPLKTFQLQIQGQDVECRVRWSQHATKLRYGNSALEDADMIPDVSRKDLGIATSDKNGFSKNLLEFFVGKRRADDPPFITPTRMSWAWTLQLYCCRVPVDSGIWSEFLKNPDDHSRKSGFHIYHRGRRILRWKTGTIMRDIMASDAGILLAGLVGTINVDTDLFKLNPTKTDFLFDFGPFCDALAMLCMERYLQTIFSNSPPDMKKLISLNSRFNAKASKGEFFRQKLLKFKQQILLGGPVPARANDARNEDEEEDGDESSVAPRTRRRRVLDDVPAHDDDGTVAAEQQQRQRKTRRVMTVKTEPLQHETEGGAGDLIDEMDSECELDVPLSVHIRRRNVPLPQTHVDPAAAVVPRASTDTNLDALRSVLQELLGYDCLSGSFDLDLTMSHLREGAEVHRRNAEIVRLSMQAMFKMGHIPSYPVPLDLLIEALRRIIG